MELLAAALAEPFRDLYLCITARVKNQFKIHSHYKDLEEKMASLLELKQGVDRGEALFEVRVWSKRVAELMKEFDPVKADVAANGEFGCIRSLDCMLSSNIVRWLEEAKQLIADGKGFQNTAPEAIQHIPGPSVVGQATASRNLEDIMELLRNDTVRMIGVWGMGGVGKTCLIQNLNNQLEKSSDNFFFIVIWVVVSQDGTWKTIQTRIAERLRMSIGEREREHDVRNRLYRTLKEGRFLLILDDLWNEVELDKVGIPQLEELNGSKIIITSRSAEVCNSMRTDRNFKVSQLSDEEAWDLFVKNVGEEVVKNEEIKPLAKEVVAECSGLPLALIALGRAMRTKTNIRQWNNALSRLRTAQPYNNEVEAKVFNPLKLSFESLESTRDMPLKSCFLFMCFFPEDFLLALETLAQYWLAEGLLDEDKNYQELLDICETIIERLKDSCLLESTDYFVKMHDVVRDVGIWIATSEDKYKSIFCAGASQAQKSVVRELGNSSCRVKRVSVISSDIESLPNCQVQCPETSTLILRYNKKICEVPHSFLKGFHALRILDLCATNMESLPDSLVDLGQLRALILRSCIRLSELPPLAALGMLLVLDCSNSGITKLPQGFEKLTNLRLLDLSDTIELKSIPAEKISKLCSLEYFNMNGSATKCGFGKGNGDEMHFEELLELNYLMTLRIDFKGLPNVKMQDVSRFQSIKKVRVSVDFDRLDFLGDEQVGWLLREAYFCSISVCEGIERLMLGNEVRNNAPFANLTDFMLSFCCISVKTSPLGQCDLMPNLKWLCLHELSGLESLSDFSNFLGLRFAKLKIIRVEYCHQLEHLLTVDNEIILPELRSIDIVRCKKLKEVFKNTSLYSFAPELGELNLDTLPELVKIFKEDDASLCNRLQRLFVRKCDMLQKLPLGIQNKEYFKIIQADQTWWDKLEWDSNDSKIRLESNFIPRN